jgi:hypothetical protein
MRCTVVAECEVKGSRLWPKMEEMGRQFADVELLMNVKYAGQPAERKWYECRKRECVPLRQSQKGEAESNKGLAGKKGEDRRRSDSERRHKRKNKTRQGVTESVATEEGEDGCGYQGSDGWARVVGAQAHGPIDSLPPPAKRNTETVPRPKPATQDPVPATKTAKQSRWARVNGSGVSFLRCQSLSKSRPVYGRYGTTSLPPLHDKQPSPIHSPLLSSPPSPHTMSHTVTPPHRHAHYRPSIATQSQSTIRPLDKI